MLVYTKQSMFDIAFKGLAAQKFARSMGPMNDFAKNPGSDENLYCRYRGEGGLKCAVGHLITDNLARDYEEQTAEVFIKVGHIDISDINARLMKEQFMSDLQHCHDSENIVFSYEKSVPSGMSVMEFNLRNFAAAENLTIPAV